MSMTDPLGDMLTRIRNGQRARQSQRAPRRPRKLRANVLEVLKREGYIRGCSQRGAARRASPSSRSS